MITPYLIFNGDCREALAFYQEVFGCPADMVQPYGEYVPEGLTDVPPDLGEWIIHAQMEICGAPVWFADEAAYPAKQGDNIRLTVTVPTKREAQEIFERFGEDVCVKLPPTQTFYSTFHAEIFDRYGIGWNIVAEEAPPKFTDDQIPAV